jgi:hypothetical protein
MIPTVVAPRGEVDVCQRISAPEKIAKAHAAKHTANHTLRLRSHYDSDASGRHFQYLRHAFPWRGLIDRDDQARELTSTTRIWHN